MASNRTTKTPLVVTDADGFSLDSVPFLPVRPGGVGPGGSQLAGGANHRVRRGPPICPSDRRNFDPDVAAPWTAEPTGPPPLPDNYGWTDARRRFLLATTTWHRRPRPRSAAVTVSVQLKPGDNVAGIVSRAAPGTTFWFTAGTYTGVSIAPKANQVFLGGQRGGAGGEREGFAFRSAAAGVTIKGLVIEGYRSASRAAVIDGVDGAAGWTVIGNEIRNNNELGIRPGSGWTVSGNYVHHNGRYGITGSGSGLLVENNEIAYNANVLWCDRGFQRDQVRPYHQPGIPG